MNKLIHDGQPMFVTGSDKKVVYNRMSGLNLGSGCLKTQSVALEQSICLYKSRFNQAARNCRDTSNHLQPFFIQKLICCSATLVVLTLEMRLAHGL